MGNKEKPKNRKDFFILLNSNVIGELSLKHIDFEKKECELSIHLQNDFVKNKGYGAAAERLALAYAFEKLGMETVLADSVLKASTSWRKLVLPKLTPTIPLSITAAPKTLTSIIKAAT